MHTYQLKLNKVEIKKTKTGLIWVITKEEYEQPASNSETNFTIFLLKTKTISAQQIKKFNIKLSQLKYEVCFICSFSDQWRHIQHTNISSDFFHNRHIHIQMYIVLLFSQRAWMLTHITLKYNVVWTILILLQLKLVMSKTVMTNFRLSPIWYQVPIFPLLIYCKIIAFISKFTCRIFIYVKDGKSGVWSKRPPTAPRGKCSAVT